MGMQRYRILIVEDDDNIRRFVKINLARNEFEVVEAVNGEEALQIALSQRLDLVVLDVNLPGMDGFEVCRRVGEQLPDLPIILLTARGQDMDKIMGLELGADDYMVKPFNPLELIARIRAVLRRMKPAVELDSKLLQSGPFQLSIESNRVSKQGKALELTPKEFLMMKTFMENPDKALGRDELLNLVWGQDYVGDPKTVDVHVRRLREKIEDDGSKPYYIETVWGFGYRWRKEG